MDQGRPVRVGLLGFGHIAGFCHGPILAHSPAFELLGVAESDPKQAAAASRLAPGASVLADYRELLQDPRLEAVVICLPTGLHAPAALAAMERGLHVYLEKPIAADLEDGRQVLSACQERRLVGQIGFNSRFSLALTRTKASLERVGPLVAVQAVFTTPGHGPPEGWRQSRATGGGILLDHASHIMDSLRYLLGQEPEAVRCDSFSQDQLASFQVRFANGILAQGLVANDASDQQTIELFGQQGCLRMDRLANSVRFQPRCYYTGTPERVARAARWLATLPGELVSRLAAPRDPSFLVALQAFADNVRRATPASPDFHDGLRSLEMVMAALQSADSRGQWVPANKEGAP